MTDNTTEAPVPDVDEGEAGMGETPAPEPAEEPADEDSFPRAYVEDLRHGSGKYRQRAQRAEQRLHTELVRATGRLADPTDLPFDPEHLDDDQALSAAIDDLPTRKPHLAARKPMGDIGQGATPASGSVDLAAILRGNR